jgi:hypothetical protein
MIRACTHKIAIWRHARATVVSDYRSNYSISSMFARDMAADWQYSILVNHVFSVGALCRGSRTEAIAQITSLVFGSLWTTHVSPSPNLRASKWYAFGDAIKPVRLSHIRDWNCRRTTAAHALFLPLLRVQHPPVLPFSSFGSLFIF